MFDILMVFLEDLFQKVNFESNQQTTKKHGFTPNTVACTSLFKQLYSRGTQIVYL